MAASGAKTLPSIGFLTVIEHSDWGLTGGLLVLNVAGRPLEFHCTAPLKPNRAQEILYGPTLRPFLYGEQIGQTLLSKAKSDALFYCTDVEPAMCVRHLISLPIVLIREPSTGTSGADPESKQLNLEFDAPPDACRPRAAWSVFSLGTQTAAVMKSHSADQDIVVDRWQPYVERFDLQEPFGRIREALDEAQRSATK